MTTDDIENYFGSTEKVAEFLESQARPFTSGVIELVALSLKDVQQKQPIGLGENWFSIPTFTKSIAKLQ